MSTNKNKTYIEKEEAIKDYLSKFQTKITKEEYLHLEKQRIRKANKSMNLDLWANLLTNQNFQCYYCNVNIEVIQELIINRIINPRKRGKHGYSGMHFEVDHKNFRETDNSKENLVASCYFCNNDKSNTISSEIFGSHFGPNKGNAFKLLFEQNKLKQVGLLRHNYNLTKEK